MFVFLLLPEFWEDSANQHKDESGQRHLTQESQKQKHWAKHDNILELHTKSASSPALFFSNESVLNISDY